jgi:hypothetical protein
VSVVVGVPEVFIGEHDRFSLHSRNMNLRSQDSSFACLFWCGMRFVSPVERFQLIGTRCLTLLFRWFMEFRILESDFLSSQLLVYSRITVTLLRVQVHAHNARPIQTITNPLLKGPQSLKGTPNPQG